MIKAPALSKLFTPSMALLAAVSLANACIAAPDDQRPPGLNGETWHFLPLSCEHVNRDKLLSHIRIDFLVEV
jgi:hypothetical protein